MQRAYNDSELVYSTAEGRICPACNRPVHQCICSRIVGKQIIPGDGVVRVSRETKGRRGKGVSVITGVPVSADELKRLAKELKRRCGCGGTVKEGVIEIQGDHRDVLVQELKNKGFTAKKAGG